MIKRLMYVALAFAVALGLTGKVDEVSAEKKVGKCTIKIDADKHGLNGGFAVPTGAPGCEQWVGWYDGSKFLLDGVIVKNGDVLTRPSLGTKYSDYDIRVITKGPSKPKPAPKKENKPKQQPKPKPQPKQESKPKQQQTKPKQESKPKQQPTKPKQETKPKQQSQPKVQHKSQPKQENKPKQQVQNTQKNAQSKQVAKAETKKDENMRKKEEKIKTEEESKKEKEEPKKEKENEEKGKKLSVAELKSKNAEVVKEGNKFYAVYKDEEGKEVKQEISEEEEAKELGYKEKVETAEPVKEETEETPVEKKEDDDKKSSKTGVIVGTLVAALEKLGAWLRGLFHL